MINLLIYIVSTVFTYVLGILSKKLKWNEELPIPIQNIMVGLIVFGIAYLITKPTDYMVLVDNIWCAMGGAGTATLAYDTIKINKEDKNGN